MHSLDLIVTLAGSLTAALAAGYVTHRLGLSPLVGYLFAGILIGPHTPGFTADQGLAEQLAEVGVILLMFGIGLHFHVQDLLAVRRIAIPGAIVQSVAATALGATTVHAFGWDWTSGIVFGIALSVASTVVLVRVLSDNNDLHTPAGHIAVGWLVVEDILTVLVLVLMPIAVDGAAARGTMATALGLALLKVGALVAVVTIGGRALPWILNQVAATRSRELFTLAVLAVALGLAASAATVFGVSMALGAFLAGLVVGRSDFSVRAASEALPMRDAFAVLFFVSVGMLLDPRYLLDQPMLIMATVLVVVVAKPLAALAITRVMGYQQEVAVRVAVALAQIGEFSFIVAALGNELGVLGPDATNTIVAAAIVSITLNPILYRASTRAARWAARRHTGRVQAPMEGNMVHEPIAARFHAVVVGFGPVGRAVTRLLRENQIEPTVIELNMDTVRQLREEGIGAVYGDASHPDTFKAAGVSTAQSVMLSAAGMQETAEVIRVAREINPDVQIIARSASLREQAVLRKAGADIVFSGEAEVALAFTEAVLKDLGATPEQIERERERVHAELSEAVA